MRKHRALIEALKGTTEDVESRDHVVFKNMGLQTHEVVPTLIQGLKDTDRSVSTYAAHMLGKIGPEAMPALSKALKDADSGVRVGAAYALGRIGSGASKVVPELIQALQDKSPVVRNWVMSALEKIGTPKALDALSSHKRDANFTLYKRNIN